MSTKIKMIFMVAVAVVAISVSSASAGLIAAFSGNVQETGTSAVTSTSGTVSFAVFDKTISSFSGDTWGTGFGTFDAGFLVGTGSPGLATGDRYLYVYTVANDGPSAKRPNIFAISQFIGNASLLGSWGHWAGLGLTDGSDVIAGNAFGTASGFQVNDVNDPVAIPALGAGLGGSPWIKTVAAGVAPALVTNVGISFSVAWAATLTKGDHSDLFGFTSFRNPSLAPHRLLDSEEPNSSGFAASPVPEPTSLVLLGIGALCGIPALRRRMKKQAAA